MGNFSLNGTLSLTPDPNFVSYGLPVRGAFVGGGFVRQGKESGILQFPPLSSAMRNELYTRWAANKNGLVGGAIPQLSGYGWQACTAAWGEFRFQGYDGEWSLSGTMIVAQILRY